MQRVRAHHQVAVEEVGRKGLVGADPADVPRQVEHDIGRMLFEQSNRVSLRNQVVIAAADGEHPVAATLPQSLDDVAAQKATAARDHDPFAL